LILSPNPPQPAGGLPGNITHPSHNHDQTHDSRT
jgi:hypothetical protein